MRLQSNVLVDSNTEVSLTITSHSSQISAGADQGQESVGDRGEKFLKYLEVPLDFTYRGLMTSLKDSRLKSQTGKGSTRLSGTQYHCGFLFFF